VSPILESIGSVKGFGWGALLSSLAFESIATATPTSGTSVSFSSIPSTYKHLQIRFNIIDDTAGSTMTLRFNGDAGSNYSNHSIYADRNVQVGTQGFTSTSFSRFLFPNGTNNSVNRPNVGIIDLHNYASTTQNKTIRSFCGTEDNGFQWSEVVLASCGYFSNTAISSIVLAGVSGFVAGTTVSLYGIK
jgi:hypothetical protein